MTEREKARPRVAVGDVCFHCKEQIVKIQTCSEANEQGGAPITALVERHWVTPHGALCDQCHLWYVVKWGEYRMAKEWLS